MRASAGEDANALPAKPRGNGLHGMSMTGASFASRVAGAVLRLGVPTASHAIIRQVRAVNAGAATVISQACRYETG